MEEKIESSKICFIFSSPPTMTMSDVETDLQRQALNHLDRLRQFQKNRGILISKVEKANQVQDIVNLIKNLRKQGILFRAYALSLEIYLYTMKEGSLLEKEFMHFLQLILDLEKEIPSFQVGRVYTIQELLTLRQLSMCLEILIFNLIKNPTFRNHEVLRLEKNIVEYGKILRVKAITIKNYLIASHASTLPQHATIEKENGSGKVVQNPFHHSLNEIISEFDRLTYYLMIVKNEDTKLKEMKDLCFDEKKLSLYHKMDTDFLYLTEERRNISNFSSFVTGQQDTGAISHQLRSNGYQVRILNGIVLAVKSCDIFCIIGDNIDNFQVEQRKVLDFYLLFTVDSNYCSLSEAIRSWQFYDNGKLKTDYIYLDEVHQGYASTANSLFPLLNEEIDSILHEILATDPSLVGSNSLGTSITSIGYGANAAVASLLTNALSNKLQKTPRTSVYKASQLYAFAFPGVLQEDRDYFHQSYLRQYTFSLQNDSTVSFGCLLGYKQRATSNNYFRINLNNSKRQCDSYNTTFQDLSNCSNFATYLHRVEKCTVTENEWKNYLEEYSMSFSGIITQAIAVTVNAVRFCFNTLFCCFNI